jgi:hypothetical protein
MDRTNYVAGNQNVHKGQNFGKLKVFFANIYCFCLQTLIGANSETSGRPSNISPPD